ncbi:metal ABC transporter permease [Agrococcus sediminis]|uniref:Metal ABC transporter permease n=1 Tax=Agrococcus sediminis TaxID=2599924 RepID=A0A5M8QM88_9MICO|nr:metal ABC transporter permease [Agrococcus sediminis]KAA6436074.1 metal ABC transporter permease [Agrococcus sediminis]
MTAPLALVLDPFTPFAVPFLLRPLLLLLALAVAAGTVGMLVHLRRLEFSADGLTHAVFPGLAIGAALGGAAGLLPGALGAALVAAVVLALLSRRGQPRDTAVAIVLTTFFSVGIVLVSLSEGAGSVSDFFFGRLLTITWADLWVGVALVAVGVGLVVATARPQLFAAFDPAGARRAGLPVLGLETLGTVAVALVVVAASASVGTLLALAVVIVPAAAARALTRSLRAAAVVAVAFGAVTGWLGLWAVVQLAEAGVDAAPGATVALAMIAGYLVALAAGALRGRVRGRAAVAA